MRLAIPAFAVLALALAACHSDDARSCKTALDCQGVEQCVASVCKVLDGGVGGVQKLGDTCFADSDCAAGLGCLVGNTGFPNGTCSQACIATSCPAGAVCTDVRDTSAGVIACMAGCSKDADCRSGYACCTAYQGGGACLPAAFCPSQTLGTSADLGAACTSGSCAGGESCGGGTTFPSSACTRGCVVGNTSTCPANGRCADTETGAWCLPACTQSTDCRTGYSCVPNGTAGDKVCRAIAGECTAGQFFDGGTPRACALGDMPPLLVGNDGGAVGPASAPTSCQKPVRCAGLPASQMQVLGQHTVGEVLQFNVPVGTAGLTILSQAVSAGDTVTYKGSVLDNTVVPDLVKTPAGNVIWDENAGIPDGDVLPNLDSFYAGGSATTGAFTVPNTTKLVNQSLSSGLPAGKWSFKVNDYSLECVGDSNCTQGATNADRYDIQVLTKPGPLPAKGVVDIAFYIAASNGLTAQSAATSAKVQRMVQTLSTIYARAGICVGTVTFYNLQPWAQAKYATGIDADKNGPCDDLDQMFTLSQPGNTLNFFLVQSLTSSGNNGGQVVGIDGTIPGPSGVSGTVHSGAAVSIADLTFGSCGGSIDVGSCGADSVGYITAHEGGHWMGLFHTTEATGDSYDTVSDTPVCQCNTACVGATKAAKCGTAGGSTPTFVEASDCRKTTSTCQGADDVMFWQLDGSSVGTFSAQQAQIMRSNPVVR